MDKINEIIKRISKNESVDDLIDKFEIHLIIKQLFNITKKFNSFYYYLDYNLERNGLNHSEAQ